VNRNELNEFFANLGSRTVSSLPAKDRANYLNYVPLQQRTFHLNPTDAIEVISVTNKLASNDTFHTSTLHIDTLMLD
jgi:hypothetical protein